MASAFPLEFKVGDELDCTMALIDDDPLPLKTEIVFSEFIKETKAQIYGLKFNDLDSEATSILQTSMVRVDRIIRGKNIE